MFIYMQKKSEEKKSFKKLGKKIMTKGLPFLLW